jgi:hypothetical protein
MQASREETWTLGAMRANLAVARSAINRDGTTRVREGRDASARDRPGPVDCRGGDP